MKLTVTLFLIFSVLLQPVTRVVIYFSFKVNQEYIAKNLCEKRDVPESACQGNCLLSKKLKQQEKPDTGQPKSISFPEVLLFHKNLSSLLSDPGLSLIEIPYGFYHDGIRSGYHNQIFHPPSCS